MNKVILFLSLIFLSSCFKEYYPEKNAYRDKELFGTWIRLSQLTSDNPYVYTYTEEGYYGFVDQLMKFDKFTNYYNLEGIWYVEKANSNNDYDYNRIFSQKRFRNGLWRHTEEYYIKNDTLFLRDLRFDWDTLVKYNYQLIYDGPNFVRVDSIK